MCMIGLPSLIQSGTDEMSKGLRFNLALLLDSIHIHSKPEPLPAARRVSAAEGRRGRRGGRVCSQCLDVGGKTRHAEVQALRHGEYLVVQDRVSQASWGDRTATRRRKNASPRSILDTTKRGLLTSTATHLFEIGGDCERLVSETEIAGYCGAVLAHHCDHAPAVVFHYRLCHRKYRQSTAK